MLKVYLDEAYLARLNAVAREKIEHAARNATEGVFCGAVAASDAALPSGWDRDAADAAIVVSDRVFAEANVVSVAIDGTGMAGARTADALTRIFSIPGEGGLSGVLAARSAEAIVAGILQRHGPAVERLNTVGRAYVFGAGRLGQLVADGLKARGWQTEAMLENNQSKWSTDGETPIVGVSPELDRTLPVIIGTTRFAFTLGRQLSQEGFTQILPYPVLTLIDATVFPPEIPYIELYGDLAENKHKYLFEYLNYHDDRSRDVLDTLLKYRITLDAEVIQKVAEPEVSQYFDADYMPLSQSEVFVDAGGFDGMTTKLFIENASGKYQGIYYFEPDRELLELSKRNLADFDRIDYVPAGAFSYDGSVEFVTTGTTNGAISIGERDPASPDERVVKIAVRRIDSIATIAPTIIKMDIEGAEGEALRGAEATIKAHAPRLAIAAYHKGADLWQLSELIRTLNPHYKIGLRHYTESGLETVIYAVAGTPADVGI